MKVALCKMYMDEEIKKAVMGVLDSGIFINGPQAQNFEKEFAQYIGVKRGVAVTSGTSALFLTFMYMGLRAGDEVIVPSHTFIASISQAIHFGAKPVFVEVDPFNYTIDIADLKRKITKRTRAIVAVHIYGHPVDMDPIMEIAHEHNLIVIEDCAQAHGSKYKGKIVGSIGHFGCYSFFPSKIMTVGGDGGMIVTNDSSAADRMEMLKNHGRKDKYVHELFGMNMRMPEIPAAIGRVELSKISIFLNERKKIVNQYNAAFKSIKEIQIPLISSWADPIFYVYTIQVDNRDKFEVFLKENGVSTGIYYPVPLHQQPVVIEKFGKVSLPVTERICQRIISLPLSPVQTKAETDYVIATVQSFFKK